MHRLVAPRLYKQQQQQLVAIAERVSNPHEKKYYILYTSYDDAEERWPLSFISSMI